MSLLDKFLAWLYTLFILFLSAFKITVDAATIACALALILVVVDSITGVMASKYEGKIIRIRSKRMRWSFAKLAVYTAVVAFTVVVGNGLHNIEISINPDMYNTDTLKATLYCVRVEAYFIIWIETVSILENLRRRFPDMILLRLLHYIVAIEFVKKIPKLAEFIKENDNKNICGDFGNEQIEEKEDTDEHNK